MLHLFRWRPLLIGSVLLLMLGSLLVSLLPVPTVLAAGNITGTVYQDYNANGARDTSGTAPNLAIDAGVGGVTVTAYSAAGAVVATATSSSLPATLGQYTLNLGAVADSTPLRIEFTGLPSGFQPAPHGSNNATNLRFASATAAAQGGLDFGIMRPAEYCQNNPTLFTTCFTSGDPLAGGTAATGDALIAYPYTAIGQNPALLSHLTLSQQIGATWGLAYRRATHQLFTGALMKRHAGLGPLGTGGLYVVDYSNPALPATSNFLDLQTLAGVSTGTDPRSAPGYPALPANKNVSSLDPGAFDAVGKIGLGGIDLSTDENTLYVMNLNSRELLAVDLASKTLVSRTAVGNPGCTNAADVRPWAVKVHDGQVYIGVVCSAQSSGNRADLDFLIARLNGGAFTTVFNGDLGYTKGATHSSFPAACNRWEPWATTFADLVRIGSVAAGTRVCRPQPILSDLEFDTDGSIIAGFVDRTGHQTGVSQRATSAADATLYSGYVNGDILRIYNNAGTFVLESGGTTPAGGGCGLNGQGPGGGEFYCGEFYSTLHNETSLGGLARWPGANELPLTVMDPLDIFSGGVSWMNNSTGADNRRYELFSNTIGGAVPITNTGTFGKAAGLGDIEALCDAAPIEIGNRVWSDTNQNGIQDAGEPGIAGVTVTLYDDAGAAVPNASAITDGSGAYFFSSAAGTNSTSAIYNLPIAPNTSYSIRIDNPADFGPGGVLADAALAPANADASANGDTRDSDAVANAPGDVRIAVGTGPAGANDHTYDAGFTPQLRLGNLVWDDANNNGLKDPAESGIGSVPVNLYRDSDNNGVPDGLAIDTTLTVAGVYTFTGLISDTYIVEIVPPPGYRSSTGANGAAIGPYEGAATPDPDSNIDGDDNGTSAGATIRSKPIALAANSEPDVGVDGDGTSGNLTVDFGLFQPYSLGNRVWFDLNNNGAIDPGESGIANQPVYLLSSDGTTLISSTSTLNGGYYRFDNLGAGDYLVAAETPAGYISSTRGEEADPNADGDSNDNGVTVNGTTMRSAPVTLGASAEPTGETDLGTGGQGAADNHANMTVDFGFTQPVALGNLIWFDADNNHLFDLGESGIVSVTVQLFPAGANPLTSTATLTTTTAGGGFYVFDQLAPGQYFAFIPPSQFGPGGALEGLFSTTGSGSSPSADDDLDENGIDSATPGTTGISSMVYTLLPNSLPIAETGQGSYGGTLDDDNVNLTADFGFHEHVALGNLVWFDSNNDGVKDPGESAASGVEVRLFTSGADPLVATPVLTTTTDASGRYVFDQLVPGQYFVHIPPSQFGPGGALHGATSSTGSGTSQAADQDVDENGIDAATPATTGISSMVYNLQPNSLPIGDDDTGYTGTLDDDNVNLTADFGFFTKVALGNLVWFDSNNNGVKDPAESGIKDVTVLLFPAGASPLTGTATLTTTTDASGRYVFDQLVPGQYFVHIPPGQFGPGGALAGHVSSTGSGTSQAADQDVDENGIDAATPAVTGISSIAYNLQPNGQPIGDDDTGYTGTLDDNDTNLTADFGFYTPVNLGNLVWHDANNNGAKDPAESGIDGVGLQLFASGADPLTATPILTTTSSGGGLYHFDTLAPGSYFVYLPTPPAAYPASSTPTDPADNGQDNDDNGAQAAPGGPTRSPDIALSAGGEPGTPTDGDDTNGDQTIDFGFFAAYSLGNRVWNDANNNGQIDPAESGIAGVTAELWAANPSGTPLGAAPVLTDTTSSGGFYLFTGLLAGDYVVVIPSGNFAGAGALAGFHSSGVTQSGEAPASTDTTASGTNNDHGTTLLAAAGAVPAGAVIGPRYTLGAGQPTGEDGNTTPGHPDGTSDDRSNLTADFGFYSLSLGNIAWNDANNDGLKGGGESGIDGLTVNLYADANGDAAPDGAPIASTTTSNGGHYLFGGLRAGSYLAELVKSGAYSTYTTSSGTNGSASGPYEPGIAESNSPADEERDHGTAVSASAIRSGTIALTAGAEPAGETDTTAPASVALPGGSTLPSNPAGDSNTNTTIDFGLYQPLGLGNLVWHDANNNGAKDPAESGIDGVGLQLFASGADPLTATPILTTTSSGGGLYHFDTLAPGSYFVYLPTPPAAYPASSTLTDPADNGQDNDDNGAQAAPGGPTRSPDIALSAGGEPGTPTDGDDTNGDQTIDFGFFAAYSLGNRVWYDTNDNGQIDPAESGIAGVVVSVLADANGDGIPDLLDAPIATVTTDSAGYYRFDDLPAGGYVVRVEGGTAAGQNYGPGGALVGYTNSTPTEATPDSDADSNDNGINTASPVGGGVLSGPITLGPGASEPAGESEPASYGPGATTGSAAADLRANLTVDFGFYRLAVGNLLWYDGDNDGLKDPAESPLGAGVLIELRTAGGTLVATTTTISGTYSFDRQTSGPNAGAGLVAGDYLVQIPAGEFAPGRPLDGYVSSAPTEADPDTNVDEAGSGPTPGDNGVNDTSPASNGIRSGTLTLTPGSAGAANNNSVSNASGSTTNPTLDFGFTQLVRLGNRVWIDQNGDGLQGVGEPGLAGATVTLFAGDGITPATDLSGSPVAPIVTGATGAYTFTALLPGDYVVRAAPPAGYIATRSGGDPDNDDNTDSNGNPVVGQPYAQSTPVTLTVGGEPDTPADGDGPNGNLTVDFGFFQPVSVGDFVWEDQNGNGLQDSGEPGVAGVTATLFAGGIATLTTTTDLGGQYLFANLPPGQYEVHFSGLPGGLVPTIANVPGDDTIDSDGLIATSAPLAAGAADRTLDLGLLHPLSLGNLVFEDGDNNGSFDSVIDRPLAGATVVLFKGDGITPATDLGGAPVINQTTGTNGLYLFTNLAPGAYVAKVLGPAGYTSSDDLATTAGPDGNLNDDDNGVGTANLASSQPITLTSSLEPTNDGDADPNSNLTLDFGFWKPLRLGNLVWLDINNNGVKDLAEGGINGVAVDLYADANGDGLPGGGELAGSTTTSGGGLYQFTNLRPGDYIVVIGAPNFAALGPLEHLASSSGGASEPAPDVDANPADGDDNGTAQPGGSVRSAPLTLTSGGEPDTAADGDDTNGNQTVDFGFYPLAAIGDTTWLDTNSDGVLNNGEAGLPGVTVQLYRPGIDGQPGTADDVLAGSTVSGVNGAYSFTDLPAGDYFVQFTAPAGYALSPQDQGGNDAADSDADSTTGRTIITTLVPGENDPTWDAGLIYNASLGDRVWLDQNANGVQDAGEPGVPGVTVVLRDAGGTPVLTTTTDLSGSYGFARLAPGSYSIAVLPPSGYQASPADQGGSDTADSDIDPASGHTGPIVIAVGTADPSWDAGLYQEVSLGNLVWNDINNNGLVDRGEPGVGGVLVRLYRDSNANGILDGGDLPAGSTTTSAGLYLFDQLTPGRYLVQLDPANFAGGAVLAGYASSTGGIATNLQPGGPYEPAPNPNTDIDNDDSGSTGQGVVSGPIVLSSAGEPTSEDRDANSNLTIDFGVFMPASVGSVVWFDTNGDGVRDPGEAGVPNVTVTLYDANGQALASTTTGPDGTYLFTDLPPGVYTLGVSDLPQGLVFTSPNQGSDDSRDSDVDPATGRTEPITLVPGSNQPNWWAGLIPNPTAVTLRSFTATWRGSVLEVAWETSAELHSLGFYLYRSTTGRRGDAVLVTPSLIAARGRGQGGAAYTWYDGSTEPGQRYSYWLAEIELNGRVNEYGPADSAGTAAQQVLYVPVVVR